MRRLLVKRLQAVSRLERSQALQRGLPTPNPRQLNDKALAPTVGLAVRRCTVPHQRHLTPTKTQDCATSSDSTDSTRAAEHRKPPPNPHIDSTSTRRRPSLTSLSCETSKSWITFW